MAIDINELRKVIADCYWPTSPVTINELLDRLEAAESEALEQARLNGMGSSREAALAARLEAAEKERDWHAERCEDAMNECDALRAKLEAAESDAAHQKALTDSALRVAKGWEEKCNSLRARIAEMEQQAPVGKFVQHPSNGLWEQDGYGDNPDANPLYALPGAKGEEK